MVVRDLQRRGGPAGEDLLRSHEAARNARQSLHRIFAEWNRDNLGCVVGIPARVVPSGERFNEGYDRP